MTAHVEDVTSHIFSDMSNDLLYLGNMLLLLPSDNLPKVIGLLQDRKRTPSATFGGGNRITLSPEPEFPTSGPRKAVVGSSNRPDVVATCAAVASKLSSNVNGKTNDNVALPSWERIKELSRYMSKLDYLKKKSRRCFMRVLNPEPSRPSTNALPLDLQPHPLIGPCSFMLAQHFP